jgi:two-component system OmpR family response regulator
MGVKPPAIYGSVPLMNEHIDHILVVDDDPGIRRELNEYLRWKGFRVSTAHGGAEMRRVIERTSVDLVILDLTMPDDQGERLIRDILKASNAGIIILTGSGDPLDQVVYLELGADDYISKPCELRTLLARIHSVLRRVRARNIIAGDVAGSPAKIAEFASWQFDLAARRLVGPDGGEVVLTTAQFELLQVFVARAGVVINRDKLLDSTKGHSGSPLDRSIDNLVSRLRGKIEVDAAQPQLIKTVRGAGYVFTPKVTWR